MIDAIAERAAALRAARAWLDLDQQEVADGAGIGEGSLLNAEKGRRCSDKSWEKLAIFYAGRGLHWREDEAGELDRLLVLARTPIRSGTRTNSAP